MLQSEKDSKNDKYLCYRDCILKRSQYFKRSINMLTKANGRSAEEDKIEKLEERDEIYDNHREEVAWALKDLEENLKIYGKYQSDKIGDIAILKDIMLLRAQGSNLISKSLTDRDSKKLLSEYNKVFDAVRKGAEDANKKFTKSANANRAYIIDDTGRKVFENSKSIEDFSRSVVDHHHAPLANMPKDILAEDDNGGLGKKYDDAKNKALIENEECRGYRRCAVVYEEYSKGKVNLSQEEKKVIEKSNALYDNIARLDLLNKKIEELNQRFSSRENGEKNFESIVLKLKEMQKNIDKQLSDDIEKVQTIYGDSDIDKVFTALDAQSKIDYDIEHGYDPNVDSTVGAYVKKEQAGIEHFEKDISSLVEPPEKMAEAYSDNTPDEKNKENVKENIEKSDDDKELI